MRDIKILINEDHSVEFDNDYAGLNQENLQGNITFSFKNFVDGQARAEVILDNDGEYEDGYILLDKVGQTYTMPIKSSLLNCKSIIMQLVIDETDKTTYQLTTDTDINHNKTYYIKVGDSFEVVEHPQKQDIDTYYEASIPVWKSKTFTLKVGFSINATSTIPEDYPSWIEVLNNLIEEVDQAVEEANNLDLDMTNENGVVIAEITKKDGSVKEVEVIDTNDYYTKEEVNNKGYINKDVDNLTNYTKTSDLSNVALSGEYSDLKHTPDLSIYSLITETGAKIDLEINSTTYVLTAKLYDKNNNLLSTSTGIDLPLETMVVGASYDSETKEIILTLKNGQEVRFSVADLVSGLQTEITPSNKLASDLVDDTNQTHKFVSQSEKTQITTNATNIAGIKNGTTINSFSGVESALNGKEDKSNKVTSISSSSTDTQYPSAKCVYDSQALQDNEISDLKSENDYLNSIINQLPKVSSQGTILTLNNTINGRMNIELGTSELSQDGTPTPDTPYPIHTISGSNTIKVIGNQLVDFSNPTSTSGVTLSFTNDTLTITGNNATYTNASWDITSIVKNNASKVFKIGFNNINVSGGDGGIVQLVIKNNGTTSYRTLVNRSGSIIDTYTIPNDTSVITEVKFNIYANSSGTAQAGTIVITKPLAYFDNANTYNPYVSQEVNINLGDIEYCEIGDYKDAFVRDNEGNWGIRKNIGKSDLKNNTIVLQSINSYNIANFLVQPIETGVTDASKLNYSLCNRFGVQTTIIADTQTEGFLRTLNVGINALGVYIRIKSERANTVETFKNWLENNPTYYYWALSTPTYTPITGQLATDLENIYQYLLSQKGQTNISQINADLPFNISASALLDLNTLVGE